jgi:hypothetical protein
MNERTKVKIRDTEDFGPVQEEYLDGFVVSLLEALKSAEDPYAVAEVKGLLISTALEELLLFVGISAKQSGTSALFGWTEHINKPGE